MCAVFVRFSKEFEPNGSRPPSPHALFIMILIMMFVCRIRNVVVAPNIEPVSGAGGLDAYDLLDSLPYFLLPSFHSFFPLHRLCIF
jgi:hypothetical protein